MDQFGIIIGGDVPTALNQLGASWWYAYGNLPSAQSPGSVVAQISLRPTHGDISLVPVATLQAAAQARPGSYWIIGNEPNNPGQDNVTPDQYIADYEYYASAIRGADPTAKLVGPNVLNFDFTCTGCGGYESGHAWIDGLRSSWASQFGGEPDFDVWSVHGYAITWDQLPMTNAVTVEQQVSGLANYLAAIPADAGKPIWLTEFGILWAFDGYTGATTGCADAPNCLAPVGSYDQAAVDAFLTTLLPWLQANSSTYNLQKWFVYIASGQPEPNMTAFGGIALLTSLTTDATLTESGQIYHQYLGS